MANLNEVLGAAVSHPTTSVSWPQITTQTSATCTAVVAAPLAAGRVQHLITGWTWSYSGGTPVATTIQVLDGARIIDQIEVPALTIGPIICEYVKGYLITAGSSASVTCPTLGAGVKCTIVLRGKTVSV